MLSTVRAFAPSFNYTSTCHRFSLEGLRGMAAFAVAWALLLALATRHRIGRHHDGLLGLAVSTWPGDWRDAWTDGPHANGEVTLHVQLLGHRIVIDYRPR